jgi:hypothetical protein
VFGEIVGNPSLSADSAGRLHLLIIVRNGVDSYLLQHWVYQGNSWTSESGFGMQFIPQTKIDSLASDFSSGGTLGVLLINSNSTSQVEEQYQLVYTNHLIDIPASTPSPMIEVTPTLGASPTTVPTTRPAVPTPSATDSNPSQIVFSEAPENPGDAGWIQSAAAVGLGLLAVVAIVIIVRRMRR